MPASPFVPDSQFINSCAQSTAVAWSLGEVTEEAEGNTTTSAVLEMLVNVPLTSFVPLAEHSMDDELEEDASFLDEIGRLFDSHKTSVSLLPHRAKLFSDYNQARHRVKRRIEQKNKWFFMQINYLCISYVLFVDIFTKSFDDFISMKFLIAVFLPASPFIPTSPFINFGDFCQPPCLLFWLKFASLPGRPFYLKLESIIMLNLKKFYSLMI